MFCTLLFVAACGPSQSPQAPLPAAPSGGAAFTALAGEYLEDLYRRQPTQATFLGIHKYDDKLDDYSRTGVTDAIAAARGFRGRVAAVDAGTLSVSNQLDREQLLRAIDSRILTLDVIRPWAKDPDGDYKKWLQDDLLERSGGDFAIGADTYARKLAADEMIELPLEQLLKIAVQKVQADHPPAAKLLAVTQAELDSIGRFMTDHHIVTVPQAAPARVQETPPFLRATTTASMDIPGPFEKVATEAYTT